VTAREVVVHEARSWLSTPYHHLANLKGVGVDCAMLVVEVFKACGLTPPDLDPRPYAPDWHMHHSREVFLDWLQQFADPVDRPLPGDVAVWRFGRTYSHGAIVVGTDGTIVHAYQEARCVTLGRLDETPLAQRPVLFWHVRGVEA
jgi:NlpC/P60 family putative phage cell wall peptidase